MLLDQIRVFLKTASGLVDKSLENQDDQTIIPMPLLAGEYIYVAQRLPFINLFFDLVTANALPAQMSLEYWDNLQWRPVVEVLDGTSSGGVTLAKSGSVQWTIDQLYNWSVISDTASTTNAPVGLNSLNIYGFYWVRISFNADLSADTEIKELGYSLSSSQELSKLDVEINQFFSSFQTGKTDWNREVMMASKLVVADLKRMGLIMGPGQILSVDDVYLPTTYRALALIYSQLGESYRDRLKDAFINYNKTISLKRFRFDGALTARPASVVTPYIGQSTRLVR